MRLYWEEVKRQFPEAWDTLVSETWRDLPVEWEDAEAIVDHRHIFSIEKDGILWMEPDFPTDPFYWDSARGWIQGDPENPDEDDYVISKEA